MRDSVLRVRPVLLTLAGVALVLVVGMQQLAGKDRRWMPTANGLAMVPRFDSSSFFRDSMLVVTLGEQEAAWAPIHVEGYYAGSYVPIAERELVAAMRAAVAERRGARVVAKRAVSQLLPHPIGVTLAYDFWDGGGVRADVIVTCHAASAAAPPVANTAATTTGGAVGASSRDGAAGSAPPVVRETMSSSRSSYSERAAFEEAFTRDLTAAAAARCPTDRPYYVRRADGGMELVDPLRARGAGAGGRAAAPPVTAAPPVEVALAAPPSRPSASHASPAIHEIRALPDTVRLTAGEVVRVERALRLTAIRADGSIVEHFAPVLAVEDPSIARMEGEVVRGVAPGTTRLTIRPATPGVVGERSGSARAQVILKVTP